MRRFFSFVFLVLTCASFIGCGGSKRGDFIPDGGTFESASTAGQFGADSQASEISLVASSVATNAFLLKTASDVLAIEFYRPDVLRLELNPPATLAQGEATASGSSGTAEVVKIVDYRPVNSFTVSKADLGGYFQLQTDSVFIRIYKSPLRLAAYKSDNQTVIWEESSPLRIRETNALD